MHPLNALIEKWVKGGETDLKMGINENQKEEKHKK
jgi:hypothetical protein